MHPGNEPHARPHMREGEVGGMVLAERAPTRAVGPVWPNVGESTKCVLRLRAAAERANRLSCSL